MEKAINIQIRSVYALLMREFQTRFGAKKLGFLWAIFEAAAHVSVFAMIKHFLRMPGPDGINLILFLVTGIVPYFYFRNVISRMMSAFTANKSLLSIPQVSFLDFYYARFILESFLVLITLPILMLIAIIVVQHIDYYHFTGYEINNILYVLAGLSLLGLLGFGAGLIVSSISVVYEPITMITSVVLRILYFTSGVIISVDRVPYRYHDDYLYWNPIVHCMEILRTGFFPEYTPYENFLDYGYVLCLSLVLIFLGLALTYKMKSWVMR